MVRDLRRVAMGYFWRLVFRTLAVVMMAIVAMRAGRMVAMAREVWRRAKPVSGTPGTSVHPSQWARRVVFATIGVEKFQSWLFRPCHPRKVLHWELRGF